MREVRTAPTSWPTDEAWTELWRQVAEELDRLEVDRHGEVHHPDDPLPGRLRLIEGAHLRSGARYDYEDDHSRGQLSIDGPGRVVLFALTPLYAAQDRALEVRLDGLDRFTAADVLFAAPNLSVDLNVRQDPEAFMDARARVPWLEGSQTQTVDRGVDGDVLRVETRLSSRGAWSPVVGSVLTLLGSLIRSGLDDMVTELGAGLSRIGQEPLVRPGAPAPRGHGQAEAAVAGDAGQSTGRGATRLDPVTPPDPDAMAEAVDQGFALLEARLTAVVDALEHRRWWRTRQGTAASTLRGLGAPEWPVDTAALGPFDSWQTVERRLTAALVATPEEHRDIELRTLLTDERETAESRVRSARFDQGAGHLMTIDTSALASPWTALKHLRRLTTT